MSWSWRIGRIAGIPIFIHWTFLILVVWLVVSSWSQTHDVARTAESVGFVLAIFGCVVLHELGHALAARRYGVPTSDITLLPIGGVARLQRIPEKPAEELVVAIAGPLVNVAIALLLFLIGVRPFVPGDSGEFLTRVDFLSRLLDANLFLAGFNLLLPAFPMDGGRVLRALLAMFMDYARATRIAASIGQLMAIFFVFLGLQGLPMLFLIALFVWIGAEAEARQVEERLVMKGFGVRDAMLTEFHTLAPTDTLGHAAELLLAGTQQDFPVQGDDGVARVLTRAALLSGLAEGGKTGLIGEAILAELGSVEANSPLVAAVARLREGGEPCLRVVERGQPIGLLTLENVGEFLMVRHALEAAAAHEPAGSIARS